MIIIIPTSRPTSPAGKSKRRPELEVVYLSNFCLIRGRAPVLYSHSICDDRCGGGYIHGMERNETQDYFTEQNGHRDTHTEQLLRTIVYHNRLAHACQGLLYIYDLYIIYSVALAQQAQRQ